MPFIQLQHSKNLQLSEAEYQKMFEAIQHILTDNLGGLSTLEIQVQIPELFYALGHNAEQKAFLLIKISMLKKIERTEEIKTKLGREILNVVNHSFKKITEEKGVVFSPMLEITDIQMLLK